MPLIRANALRETDHPANLTDAATSSHGGRPSVRRWFVLALISALGMTEAFVMGCLLAWQGLLSAAGEVNTSVDNSWRRLRMLLVRRWRAVWKRPKQPPPPASGKQQAGATRTTVTVTTTRARTIIKFTDHSKEEKEAPPSAEARDGYGSWGVGRWPPHLLARDAEAEGEEVEARGGERAGSIATASDEDEGGEHFGI